jgi:hypothetical protein
VGGEWDDGRGFTDCMDVGDEDQSFERVCRRRGGGGVCDLDLNKLRGSMRVDSSILSSCVGVTGSNFVFL